MPREERLLGSVLVIEDDAALRDIIASVLEDAGFRVRVASNGHTGLRLAQTTAPDVVMLEWRLPELDGASVLREIHRSWITRNVPAVLMTAWPGKLPESVLEDCASILRKPFDIDELVTAVLCAMCVRECPV